MSVVGCARRHGRAGCLLGAPVRVTESLTARTSTPIGGRPGWDCAGATPERVEAVLFRVWGSRGQEASLANRDKMLRDSATGEVNRGSGRIAVRVGGGSGRGWAGCSTARPRVGSRWCGWCGEIDWPGSPVGWFGRCLSEVGVTVEVLRDRGVTLLVGGLMDDVRAVPASLSGRFSGPWSKGRGRNKNQRRVSTTPRHGWERGNR